MDIQIIKANIEHAKGICDVLRRSITEVCVQDHQDDPNRLQAWLANKTEENVRKWIAEASNHTIVAVNKPAMIIGVSMFSQEGEILLNYLLPEFIACGIGKKMLLAMEFWARSQGLMKLMAVSTLTAYPFYKRNGFIENPSDSQDGIAMVKVLG